MDAALYKKLLEEVRSDLNRTAPMLEELQSVESFLQRRMETVDDQTSYQNVLDDIAADISGRNQTIEELKRIDRYVSSQLGEPAFSPETAPRSPKPESKPQPRETAKDLPPVKKTPDKPSKKESEQPQPSLANMSGASSGMTIEFGPDGFPINSGGGSSKDRSQNKNEKASVAESPAADGATINFGPDGFPVDFPKSKSNQ